MGKLINRIPGECLLISSLPGSASRMHVESLGKPCLVNLISKYTHLVFSMYPTFYFITIDDLSGQKRRFSNDSFKFIK